MDIFCWHFFEFFILSVKSMCIVRLLLSQGVLGKSGFRASRYLI